MKEEDIVISPQLILEKHNGSVGIGSNWYALGVLILVLFSCVAFVNASTRKKLNVVFRYLGIGMRRIPKVIRELKRKGFHYFGLVIPLIYLIGLNYYSHIITRRFSYMLLGAITGVYFLWECARVYIPSVGAFCERMYGDMMREKEKKGAFNGVLFYLLGTTLCIYLFSPLVAIASMLFLIIGDFCAAVIGISYGKTKIGNKSLEGSLAMFTVCLAMSLGLFWNTHLGEQIAFWGALTATLVELLNPSFIDDNLTIPLVSGLIIHLMALRLNVPIPDPSIEIYQ